MTFSFLNVPESLYCLIASAIVIDAHRVSHCSLSPHSNSTTRQQLADDDLELMPTVNKEIVAKGLTDLHKGIHKGSFWAGKYLRNSSYFPASYMFTYRSHESRLE